MDNHLLEEEIISSLLNDKKYFISTIHHLQESHFEERGTELLFSNIKSHYLEYREVPTLKELILSFKGSNDQDKQIIKSTIKEVQQSKTDTVNEKMMLKMTEEFIKRAVFKEAIIVGADALGTHNQDKMNESYTIAEESVKISLTSDLGVSLEDIDMVFDDFKEKPGYKTNIQSWDTMMGSGVTTKTLSAFAASSGVGKSAAMVDFAVKYLKQGIDVVLVSLEMSEAEFYKRIYANLYDIEISSITSIDKQVLITKFNNMKDNLGNLVVKEFPTGSLTPLGLDSFLDKLSTEKSITRPIVFVDYLGLMDSDRTKNVDNSYSFYGSIAEELRAIAQKRDISIWTALQLNRSAVNNLEATQAELSESIKILMILDFLAIIAQTPEMKEKGEMKINIVKNRFSGKTWSFSIGFDYKHFRFDDRFYMGGSNVTRDELKNSVTGEVSALSNIMSF